MKELEFVYMKNIREQLVWPNINPIYDVALKYATNYILEEFSPLGIVISGSAIKKSPNSGSDLDIVVIHEMPFRQRIYKIFHGIPTDIFINTPSSISAHLDFENVESEPKMAHMLATGFVILESSPLIQQIIRTAKAYIEIKPIPTEQELIRLRYLSVNNLVDACDLSNADPANANLLITLSIYDILKFYFREANHFIPPTKELVARVRQRDDELGGLVEKVFMTSDIHERIRLTRMIVDKTTQTACFFEWATPRQRVNVIDMK